MIKNNTPDLLLKQMQFAVSQATSALEVDLGVELIERKNRSFNITTAGDYFYRKCKYK